MAKKQCPRKLKGCKPSARFNYTGGGLSCFGLSPRGTGKVRADILRYCNINSDGTINEVTGYTPDEMVALIAGAATALNDYMESNQAYSQWRNKATGEL